MTIKTTQFTVTTTSVVIVADDLFPEAVYLHSSSGTCYIGGADVTSSNGYRIDNGDKLTLDNHDNPIYAVASGGNATLYCMVITK